MVPRIRWLRCTVVERRSLAGELSLSHARLAAGGRPLMWVNHPLQISQPGHLVKATEIIAVQAWRKVIAAYRRVDGLKSVTCRLTSRTLVSALGPALGNEYGRSNLLPFTC